MIKVKKITKPSILDSDPHLAAITESRQVIRAAISEGRNEKKVFTEKWRTVRSIKSELFDLNFGKCAYCESQERDKRTMDVEHYRPKAGVQDVEGHPGYWWLADETDNYLLSCKVCNTTHKGVLFPLLDEGRRVSDELEPVSTESPYLINPVEEDPSDFIGFKSKQGAVNLVVAVGLDHEDRGHRTIKICGLNDEDLCQARSDSLIPLQLMVANMHHGIQDNNEFLITKTETQIKKYTSSKKPYAGYRRDYFKEAGLEEFISDD